MLKVALPAALLLAAAGAVAQDLPEGAQLQQQSFLDMDEDDGGTVTAAELSAYGELVFVSMDSDRNAGIDEHEFTSWGFGQENLAEAGGQLQAYRTAQRMIFDLWDRDDDRAMTEAEQQDGLGASFAYADADGDGAMTEEEYLRHFLVNVAVRNALTAE